VRRVLDEIVAHVRPEVPTPLPTTWDGPVAQATDDDQTR
jgi:hypothetical protein